MTEEPSSSKISPFRICQTVLSVNKVAAVVDMGGSVNFSYLIARVILKLHSAGKNMDKPSEWVVFKQQLG